MKRKKPTSQQQEQDRRYMGDKNWWEMKATSVTKSEAGRPPKYDTPETLWQACCEYFEWVENNPLYETKLMQYKDETWKEYLPKKRPMNLQGLCRFLGISHANWWQYKNERSEEYTRICETAENVIYEQQFTGGATGFFNSNMISKKLGLKEQHEMSGPNGGPIQKEVDLSGLSNNELEIALKAKPELAKEFQSDE